MTKTNRTLSAALALPLLGVAVLAVGLSGCVVDNTSDGGGSCFQNQYFNVYWSQDLGGAPLDCNQATSATVFLDTNAGTLQVGRACSSVTYMGFTYQFIGSTDSVSVGTYVNQARLVDDVSGQTISTAPGPGAAYSIPSCGFVQLAYPFTI